MITQKDTEQSLLGSEQKLGTDMNKIHDTKRAPIFSGCHKIKKGDSLFPQCFAKDEALCDWCVRQLEAHMNICLNRPVFAFFGRIYGSDKSTITDSYFSAKLIFRSNSTSTQPKISQSSKNQKPLIANSSEFTSVDNSIERVIDFNSRKLWVENCYKSSRKIIEEYVSSNPMHFPMTTDINKKNGQSHQNVSSVIQLLGHFNRPDPLNKDLMDIIESSVELVKQRNNGHERLSSLEGGSFNLQDAIDIEISDIMEQSMKLEQQKQHNKNKNLILPIPTKNQNSTQHEPPILNMVDIIDVLLKQEQQQNTEDLDISSLVPPHQDTIKTKKVIGVDKRYKPYKAPNRKTRKQQKKIKIPLPTETENKKEPQKTVKATGWLKESRSQDASADAEGSSIPSTSSGGTPTNFPSPPPYRQIIEMGLETNLTDFAEDSGHSRAKQADPYKELMDCVLERVNEPSSKFLNELRLKDKVRKMVKPPKAPLQPRLVHQSSIGTIYSTDSDTTTVSNVNSSMDPATEALTLHHLDDSIQNVVNIMAWKEGGDRSTAQIIADYETFNAVKAIVTKNKYS
ncbi:Protein CBG28129 [Caenorhabditis briggsae]|uniref:Protein CBG28129 n=1 Tax=Caenorhabditis briggsae TaxID=6238 RepID=B6IHW9_CAEBR|nr:Protein CBG28129 [Caenorhabditis briggsae]CAR99499.1 Protein CBG28129 [Caenorhabditis briggsae]